MQSTRIDIAIPVMDEVETLPRTLDALAAQDYTNFTVWLCVNQPEAWWDDSGKIRVCEANAKTLAYLSDFTAIPIRVIDHSSRGKGWLPKKGGVGRARKTVMDAICAEADDSDIIVSLDADTLVDRDYLSTVAAVFVDADKDAAISIPYFHRLTGDEPIARVMLRYEIYLRYYAINLWRIGSPYCYTALGSAMAFRIFAYKKCGGMPPRESGEDFYMLQKLQKTCTLLHWSSSRVYPAARVSDRVAFGTGAALTKGLNSDWGSYPICSTDRFDNIGKTIASFPELFNKDIDTPLSSFLSQQLNSNDLWGSLRKNHPNKERFIRACHERLDGLRIFQYLRAEKNDTPFAAEHNLTSGLQRYYNEWIVAATENVKSLIGDGASEWSFATADIEKLDAVRVILSEIEDEYRKRDYNENAESGTMKTEVNEKTVHSEKVVATNEEPRE